MSAEDRQVVTAVIADEVGNLGRVDQSGDLRVSDPRVTAARAGLSRVAAGYVATSSTAFTAVRASQVTEQSSNGQRSIVGGSGDDDVAGTGARKVRIRYYDEDLNGPFEEIVDTDGTTAVATVATDICYIESLEVVEVGSGETNAGTIWLRGDNAGGGGNVAVITAGEGRTWYAHHYVPAGRVCEVASILAAVEGLLLGDANSALFLMVQKLPAADQFQMQECQNIRLRSNDRTQEFRPGLMVAGPARILAYVRADDATARTHRVSMNVIDH